MSVSLKCDSCGNVSDLALPMKFVMGDGETALEVAVIQGLKSLDLCRLCFAITLMNIADEVVFQDESVAEKFAALACKHAPDGVTYERRRK